MTNAEKFADHTVHCWIVAVRPYLPTTQRALGKARYEAITGTRADAERHANQYRIGRTHWATVEGVA